MRVCVCVFVDLCATVCTTIVITGFGEINTELNPPSSLLLLFVFYPGPDMKESRDTGTHTRKHGVLRLSAVFNQPAKRYTHTRTHIKVRRPLSHTIVV